MMDLRLKIATICTMECMFACAMSPVSPADVEIASRSNIVVASLVIQHTNLWSKYFWGGNGSWTNITEDERHIIFDDISHPQIQIKEVLKGVLTNGLLRISPFGGILTREKDGSFRLEYQDLSWSSPPFTRVCQPCIWFLSDGASNTNTGLPSLGGVWDLRPIQEIKYWRWLIHVAEREPAEIKTSKDDGYLDWRKEQFRKEQLLRQRILGTRKNSQQSGGEERR